MSDSGDSQLASAAASKTKHLVLASGASGSIAGLGASRPRIVVGLLGHHDREAHVSADGILVTGLAGVDPGGVRGVALEGLEGVEVTGGAGRVGVPLVVEVRLGDMIVKLAVILTVFEVELGGHAGVLGGDEGGGGGHEGDGDDLGQHVDCCVVYCVLKVMKT
jgi:hypothetical protein